MFIPIGTDIRTPRIPVANYAIIGANVLVFLFTDVIGDRLGEGLGSMVKSYYALDAARPALHEYITYQFLHGGWMHLAGNMLFLWIFGNAVCDRMGSIGYTLFYLASGVFAGAAFVATADNPIVGASGAIAAVTTAFLALFPRVHITILVWIIFVFTFQVPAMILIVFKMVLWDNIIAPSLDPGAAASNVAYTAHLGGYSFGFAVAFTLLLARVLPRNQFDIVALWNRLGRRHGWPASSPFMHPPTARPIVVQEVDSRPLDTVELTPVERLREEIAAHLSARDPDAALHAYQQLLELDANQVLSASAQIEMANYLAQSRRYPDAAHAYEAFLGAYQSAPEAPEVRLFLGLICARYLSQHERAARHLRAALDGLKLDAQRTLAETELRQVEARLQPPPA